MIDFGLITERVTVRDSLQSVGIAADRNRIPCPIHGGSNPTSFWFNDTGFRCFSCDVKGGLVDLVMYLHHCDRAQALRLLCSLAGLPWSSDVPRSKGQPVPPCPTPRRKPVDRQLQEAVDRYETLRLLEIGLSTALRIAKKNMAHGRMPLAEFYALEQKYLYELEELDPQIAVAKYEMNQAKKRSNHDQNTCRNC